MKHTLQSLFSTDTIEGVRSARAEAERAKVAGGRDAEILLGTCELIRLAVEASDAGRTDDARRLLGEALGDAEHGTTDPRLLFLGFQFHFRLEAYDEAEQLTHRRLAAVAPDSIDAARACTNLGLIHFMRKEYDVSEAWQHRALAIDRAIGNEEGVARDLGNLALVPEAKGDLDAAERLYLESLAIAERIGAKAIIATKLANLGDISLARGGREETKRLWTRAVSLFTELHDEKHREEFGQRLRVLDEE